MNESMAQLTIRQTAKADVNRVMEIIDIARRHMWSIGNTAQWQKGYHVIHRIADGTLHIAYQSGEPDK